MNLFGGMNIFQATKAMLHDGRIRRRGWAGWLYIDINKLICLNHGLPSNLQEHYKFSIQDLTAQDWEVVK